MRHRLLLAALVVTAGCTPGQISGWVEWYRTDPAAANTFAHRDEIQAELHANNPRPDGAGSSSDAPQFREYLTTRHDATWDRIAWCESGGQWHHPPVHNRHGSFSGGLMIKSDVWDHYGGGRYASDAWLATRAQQISIAEAILDDVGWHAWQCA